jgi:hypothetical protein
LETEALTRRKVFLREVTSNALVVIHASLDAVFESENKEKGSWAMAMAEARTNEILRLSLEDVFELWRNKLMEDERPSRISRRPLVA